ncbi:MAG: TIGR00282 family metallophosphoesterase [Holosporales bacterium]|jgi:metallophosphoesterase (TIGR00282 family)|nr:TIGR00282 family metallophosphoesterase [Holosporales bacterium]
MKILFCGDVVARSGRDVIKKYIPYLKKTWGIDCVIANGENMQHGCGLSAKTCEELMQVGVDVITTGNHVWDNKEMLSFIEMNHCVIRPINFADTVPGRGFALFQTCIGDVLVINVMGQIFITPVLDNPFPILSNFLKSYKIGSDKLKAIVIDFHGEATSEKIAMAYYLDGQVSLVVGTHTHVPTADARILPNGTAFLSDAGMCGDYSSIIGASIETLSCRYLKKIPMKKSLEPPSGEGTLCGVYIETDDETGLSKVIHPIRLGKVLATTWPQSLPMALL